MKSFKLEPNERDESGASKSFKMVRSEPASELWAATNGRTDPETQGELIELAEARSKARGRLDLLFGVGVMVLTVLGYYLMSIDMGNKTAPILALALVFTLALIHGKLEKRRARHILAMLIKRHGIRPNFCLHCRYDLKGSVSEQCPECGEKLAPPSDIDLSSND